MNNEKVKEIKKALSERTQHKPINCYNGEYVEACGMYCKFYRKFVADMGSKNGQICENCDNFTANDEVKRYVDILTLINELESENKELKKYKTDWLNSEKMHLQGELEYTEFELASSNSILQKISEENKKLKERIAELEKGDYYKEIERKKEELLCKEYGLIKYEKELVCKKLKQFAEMLKKRLYNFQTWEVPYDEWCKGNVVCGEIDETLKEVIPNESNN